MQKSWLLTIAIVLAVIGGVSYMLIGKSDTSGDPTIRTINYRMVGACDLLTLEKAKKVLGPATTRSGHPQTTIGGDVAESSCSYTNNAKVVADIRTTTVTVRSPLNKVGADSNKSVFGAKTPSGVQKVYVHHDKEAYFSPNTRTLNILSGNLWISVVSGSTEGLSKNPDAANAVAHAIFNHKSH